MDKERASAADYPKLLFIWEESVKATHDFLKAADFDALRREIPSFFPSVELYCWKVEGETIGFTGHAAEHLEMFFLSPRFRGRGYGSEILQQLVKTEGIRFVDVNQQNKAAYHFYEKNGFEVYGKSEKDGQGRDYPILHLKWSSL
ncbi:GNAT family N-acetyltransferase [Listeria kieliensis]|uniref:Acetyltransferase n=1 Tax=Listeria kieliensis TaxID=1621700 RepID=A0A3D8TVB7_9LIST|nr:GNAT family N-acetyltransferase [Listeria kieliensis]RDX02940.1 acetyltransferase [Listeria kieliensis]